MRPCVVRLGFDLRTFEMLSEIQLRYIISVSHESILSGGKMLPRLPIPVATPLPPSLSAIYLLVPSLHP